MVVLGSERRLLFCEYFLSLLNSYVHPRNKSFEILFSRQTRKGDTWCKRDLPEDDSIIYSHSRKGLGFLCKRGLRHADIQLSTCTSELPLCMSLLGLNNILFTSGHGTQFLQTQCHHTLF